MKLKVEFFSDIIIEEKVFNFFLIIFIMMLFFLYIVVDILSISLKVWEWVIVINICGVDYEVYVFIMCYFV